MVKYEITLTHCISTVTTTTCTYFALFLITTCRKYESLATFDREQNRATFLPLKWLQIQTRSLVFFFLTTDAKFFVDGKPNTNGPFTVKSRTIFYGGGVWKF